MPIIQKIRDKYAAVVIAVIAISLIAFILMDAFVGRNRGLRGGGSTLGEVNGQKIDRMDFEKKITLQQAMYGQQAPQREQIMGQVWEQQVDEIVMNQQYEKLGLAYSDKELNDYLFGSAPPQWLTQQFTDPTTNTFDVNKAKQAFAQIKKQGNTENAQMVNDVYIVPTIQQQLRAKYMALLSNSTYVPKWMAEKALAEQSSVARIGYVSVPYSSITDTTIKATDEDVQAYINKHKEQFKQEEVTRSISYVSFNGSPSAADSVAVFDMVARMKNEFVAAPDVEAYLGRVSSELPYDSTFKSASKLNGASADTLKTLADGQAYGPYIDGKNYVIARMMAHKVLPDSAKVRHILIKSGQGARDDSSAKKLADSIQLAVKNGASFEALVTQYSDDAGSKMKGGVYDYFPQGQMVPSFNAFAFEKNIGDKGVVKTDYGYHYIEVLGQKNFSPAYKIAYLAKPIEASQETINTVNGIAQQFAANSRDKKAFEENATKQNLQIQNIQEVKQNDFQVPGLGDNRQMVRWIYESKVGDVSEPFEVNDKYVIALVTGIAEKGLMTVAKARPSAEPMIINEKKAKRILETKFKSPSADINQVASGAGVQVMYADSISFSQAYIPNLGNEPKVVGAAFNKSMVNKATAPIAGNSGVFVVKPEGTRALPNTTMDVEGMRKQMESQAKQMGAYQSAQALKKAADIEDKRFDFY